MYVTKEERKKKGKRKEKRKRDRLPFAQFRGRRASRLQSRAAPWWRCVHLPTMQTVSCLGGPVHCLDGRDWTDVSERTPDARDRRPETRDQTTPKGLRHESISPAELTRMGWWADPIARVREGRQKQKCTMQFRRPSPATGSLTPSRILCVSSAGPRKQFLFSISPLDSALGPCVPPLPVWTAVSFAPE